MFLKISIKIVVDSNNGPLGDVSLLLGEDNRHLKYPEDFEESNYIWIFI